MGLGYLGMPAVAHGSQKGHHHCIRPQDRGRLKTTTEKKNLIGIISRRPHNPKDKNSILRETRLKAEMDLGRFCKKIGIPVIHANHTVASPVTFHWL